LDREPGFYREVDVDESIEIHVIFEGFYYYKVDNETYHIVDKTAVYEGNNLRKYKASKILGPNDVRLIEEDKLCHFGIICDNRVIDILSYCLPRIEIIHQTSS